MKLIRWLGVGVSLCLMLPFGPVAADDLEAAREIEKAVHLKPDVRNGRAIYMSCAGCHQPEGWGRDDGAYPQIAGQIDSVIIKQMADIRARNRDTPTMLPFAMSEVLSVQEVADVAAYVSGLPMSPSVGTGPGTALDKGAQLYRERCAECHGAQGRGSGEKHVPLIQGQHYRYLTRQFDWIRNGKRRNGDPQMVQRVVDLDATEASAVLDYVSRMKPPEEKLAKPGWLNLDFPKYVRNDAVVPVDICRIND